MERNTSISWKTASSCDVMDNSGPWVEVDLDAITHNIRQIENICKAPLMPVIKANAYGHGLVEVGRHLERVGVHSLCVGYFQEAVQLRCAGISCPLLNLGPYSAREAEQIVTGDISQSVFNGAVHLLDRAAQRYGRKARVHIKVDTGLGRVGVPFGQALEYIQTVAGLAHVHIDGVFTSLTEDKAYDCIQLERFNQVIRSAEEKGIDLGLRHAASSAAILEYPDSHLDLARPGIMVVGCYPSAREFRNRRIDLKQALTLKTRVSCVKALKAGDPVAYHQAYVAETDEIMVTGAIGYPDGYPSHLAGRGECLINGNRYPLVATITANNIYIRAGLDRKIEIGDEIVLIGKQQGQNIRIEDLAETSGLSEYKLLACLSPILPRHYSGMARIG